MKKTVKLCDSNPLDGYCCGGLVENGVTEKGFRKRLLYVPPFTEGAVPTLFYVTANGIFVAKTDKGELYYGSAESMKRQGAGFDGISFMTDYNEGSIPSRLGALCLGEGNAFIVSQMGLSRLSAYYSTNCAVLRGGRVFYADKDNPYELCWTGIGGVFDTDISLNGGGYVFLEDRQKGEIVRLFDYDDSVLCVRRYGFTKMQALGVAENFAMASSDIQTAKIFPDTVALADGCLYFCSEHGIYFYDGTDVEALDIPETDDIVPVSACGVGNVYYVYGYIPRLQGNGVACIDVERKTVSYVASGSGLLAANDKAYLLTGDGCYALEKDCEDFAWFSGKLDFGTATGKTLRYVNVPTESGVNLTVTSDKGEREITNAKGRTSVNMRGNTFTVKIEGSFDIAAVTAEIIC